MAEVKWIKITTTMFEDEKIDFIQSLPEGDAMLVIWVRLITMAGKCNAGGYIFLTENIPYTEEMLANRFKKPLNITKLALETFKKLEMVQVDEKGFFIPNFSKHQNLEGLDKIKQREQAKLRKRKQRDKQKLIEEAAKEETCSENESQYMSCDCHSDVTRDPSYIRDRKIDIEEDIDKEDRMIEKRKNLNEIEQAYFKVFHRQISSSYLSKILEILNKGNYTNLIIYALEITEQRGKEQKKVKGFSYTMAILESWINQGFKTVKDVCDSEKGKEMIGSSYKEFDLGSELL